MASDWARRISLNIYNTWTTGLEHKVSTCNHTVNVQVPPHIQLCFRGFPDADGRVADDHGPPGSAQVVEFTDLRGFEDDIVEFVI